MTVELPEDDLARLLKENDQPHRLGDDQRRRLQARLALTPPLATKQADVTTARRYWGARNLTPRSKQRGGTRRQRGGRPALVGLVAAVVAFAFVSLSLQNQERSQVTATRPSMQSCPTAAQAFLDAVDVWNGVEEWGYLTDDRAPEPDLLTLAQRALRATAGGDQRTREELAEALGQFAANRSVRRRASATGDTAQTGPSTSERQDLTETVAQVHVYLTEPTRCG